VVKQPVDSARDAASALPFFFERERARGIDVDIRVRDFADDEGQSASLAPWAR